MLISRPLRLLMIVCVLALPLLLLGCWLFEDQRNVLDAARIFRANQVVFEGIRQQYPGPFTEVRRIPAFDEADNRPEDIAFLEDLQKSIPARIIELYARGKDGPDEIEVVVGAYGLAVSGSTVSLLFFETFDREALVERGVEVFDTCDYRALKWLETAGEIGFAVVYCRLTEHWYAYQSVT